MVTSDEVLTLLLALEHTKLNVDFCISALDSVSDGSYSIREPRDKAERAEWLQELTSKLPELRLRPVIVFDEETLEALDLVTDYDTLDQHFTVVALLQVPRMVARWWKLQPLRVVLLPNEKVTSYLRQATTCYLHGLPTAAAVLCRAVLEFALDEALASKGGVSLPSSRTDPKDRLKNLINWARSTRLLTDTLRDKAHSVRNRGNSAVHDGSCTETAALALIKDTGEILRHVYGRPARRAG